jgi:hypothetical protein
MSPAYRDHNRQRRSSKHGVRGVGQSQTLPPVRCALFLWLSIVPWRHALDIIHRVAESHLICGRVNNILVQELARVDGDIEAGVAWHQVARDV